MCQGGEASNMRGILPLQHARRALIPLILSATLLLSACGNTRIERTGSGAAIGGGIGLVGGGICCQDPSNAAPGFFIGAAVGALIGLLLDHPLFFDTSSR